MLDPLTALGLASNVISLVDFAARLVKKGSEIHLRGETVDNAKLSNITMSLTQLSQNISSSIGNAGLSSPQASEEEHVLLDTARNCTSAANDLIDCLNRLKRKNGKNIVWGSIRQAIKTEWSKEDIKSMAARLDTYRSDLTLQTLVFLNNKIGKQIDSQEQRFSQLERKSNEIIEAILITQKGGIDNADTQHILHKQTQDKLSDVIAALFTHSDAFMTTISPPLASTLSLESGLDHNIVREVITLQNRASGAGPHGDGRATFSNFATIQHRVSKLFHSKRSEIAWMKSLQLIEPLSNGSSKTLNPANALGKISLSG